MDSEISAVPKVEAVPEDIAMPEIPPQDNQEQYQPSRDEQHASFFPGDHQLDAHQEQPPPEPPTPPQRASRPDVAAEDLQLGGQGDDQMQQLQLAAQMSQALRDVVGSSDSVQDNGYSPQQEPGLHTLQELQDQAADTDMQSQDHGLPSSHGLPELTESIQSNSIQQDLHESLRQVIPSPEPEQDPPQEEPHHPSHPPHPSHAPQPRPHPHSQPHEQHAQYVGTPQHPTLAPAIPLGVDPSQYPTDDMTPPRKRSKVSRACDECRRKKVKCDAVSETGGDEPCSNCRRSNVRCQFSRVPQKRGPSKGYIKELADRINSIEGKLGGQSVAEALAGELVSRKELGEGYTASSQGEALRKRPFSHVSGENTATPSPNRPPAWPSDPRPALPQQTIYSANGMALKPILPRGMPPPIPNRQPAVETIRDNPPPSQSSTPVLEVRDNVYHAYLNIIHHVLPLLPSSKELLNSHLAQCTLALRNAFVEAINSAMGSFAAVTNVQGSLATVNRLLSEYEAEGGKHSQTSDLVYLQCLILMIINVENFGPASLRREHEGPAKPSLIGRAAGMAYTMGVPHETVAPGPVADLESEQCIRIRAWWALVILDRWNAISTATPLVISPDTVVLPHNLKSVLGEANYRLTLLAYIMGHWTPVSIIAPETATPGAGARASATFHLNMEMWRAHFPGDVPSNVESLLHLSYWHCRLLAFLFMPSALITDVTWAVRESVHLLTAHPQMISPFNHHFTSLTALCLVEMTKIDDSREEASQLLNQLLEATIAPSAWDDPIRAAIRNAITVPSTGSTAETTASQSLQHLADLATAAEVTAAAGANGAEPAPPAAGSDKATDEPRFRTSDNYEDLGFDPRLMLREGYLSVVSRLSS